MMETNGFQKNIEHGIKTVRGEEIECLKFMLTVMLKPVFITRMVVVPVM